MDRIGGHGWSSRLPSLAPVRRLIVAAFDCRIRNAPGYHSRLPHHVPHAGRKTEQCEYEHPPRQRPEPLVDEPAETCADQHTRDKLGGEPETAREARVIGRRPGCRSGGRAARVRLFEPFAETLEPRREGGFIRRCFPLPVARVVGHWSTSASSRFPGSPPSK